MTELTGPQTDVVRDALGLLRAAARGDDEALAVCANALTSPSLTAAVLAQWCTDAIAIGTGGDAPELVEEWARYLGQQ